MSRDAYLARLGAGGWSEEISALAEDLTITETYFFRHAEQFRALAELALPERVAARGDATRLRLLSVGCSSGEEAYTLAIVARQVQPDPNWIVSVVGLDANPVMLRKAAAGALFGLVAARDSGRGTAEMVPPAATGRTRWTPRCVTGCGSKQHNVADEDPVLWRPDQYDVIFCRNVLMYLTPAAHAALVQRMTRSLAPGGYLFLGHTDSLGNQPDGLELRHSHYDVLLPAAGHADAGPGTRGRTVAAVPGAAPADAAADRRIRPDPGAGAEERFAEALAEVERAAPAQPRDLLLRGVLLAQAGRLDEAEMVVRGLLDADGLYADAHHLLGVCLEGGAAVDVAIEHYRLAAYLDPAFAMPRLRLGLLARRRGDDRAAAAELDRALDLLREEREDRILLFGGGFGRIVADHPVPCRTGRVRGARMSPNLVSDRLAGAARRLRPLVRRAGPRGTTSSTTSCSQSRLAGARTRCACRQTAGLHPGPAGDAAARPAGARCSAGRFPRQRSCPSTTWPHCSGIRCRSGRAGWCWPPATPPLALAFHELDGHVRVPADSIITEAGARGRASARHGPAGRRHPADRGPAGRPGRGAHLDRILRHGEERQT